MFCSATTLEVGLSHLVALGTELIHSRAQMTVSRTEAHNQQIGIVHVTIHLEVGHLDIGNLLLAQTCHQVVVLGIGRDGTSVRVLLQATEEGCG